MKASGNTSADAILWYLWAYQMGVILIAFLISSFRVLQSSGD